MTANLVTYNYSKAIVLLKQRHPSRRKVSSGINPHCEAAKFHDQSADAVSGLYRTLGTKWCVELSWVDLWMSLPTELSAGSWPRPLRKSSKASSSSSERVYPWAK